MLSRPEIGTRSHIKLWVGDQDPKEIYRWEMATDCACGQYSRAHYGADYGWLSDPNCPSALAEMNKIAQHVPSKTFGELHKTLCEAGW